MGFKILHGMETNVNETIVNYGDVGFVLIIIHQAGAINVSWGLGQPNIRAWFHELLGHFFWIINGWVLALRSAWRRLPG